MSIREDTIDRHYKSVKKLEKCSTYLFCINVFLSVAILFFEDLPILKNWTNIVFVIVTLMYSAVTMILGLWVLPKAQQYRSTHLLVNALEVPLDNESTNLYYNNNEKPSFVRLGLNLFENSLFSLRISERMLFSIRIQIFTYLGIWFFLLLNRSTPLSLLSVLAQTLFASTLLSDYIRLEISRIKFNHIYKECWNLFLNGTISKKAVNLALILNLVMRYEAIISAMTISLNSKIFIELNSDVTDEWEKIKKRLNL